VTRSGRDRLGTPKGLSPHTGPLASAAWLLARGLLPREQKWFVEIELPAKGKSEHEALAKLLLEVYAEEWGFRFERERRVSWIRVTDVPFVHGRDDHGLLTKTPRLERISMLVRALEGDHGIEFERTQATIRSNVPNADSVISSWLAEL
jgi:hypothetical protein